LSHSRFFRLFRYIILKKTSLPYFPIYRGGNIFLIVSGIGVAATAAAVGFLSGKLHEKTLGWINIGRGLPLCLERTSFFSPYDLLQLFEEKLLAEDIAGAAFLSLNARLGAGVEEISLQPQKKRLLFKNSLKT
jgi:hypothetical protein